jgi:phosphomannomutase / phosphoglucomutase
VLFGDGWGLIRASNTQPVLVLRAEAKTPEALARIKQSLEEALKQFPPVGPVRW